MSVAIADARPPYVEFRQVAVENRDASVEAGAKVYNDEDFAFITPIGSKDRMERKVSDWFAHLEVEVEGGRFAPEWLRQYKGAYAAWKEGLEPPLDGTPIRQWSVLSPAQVKSLLELRVLTVEDLAQANEETIRRLGMGGRDLKNKAVTWLESAQNVGSVAERCVALTEENRVLRESVEKLTGIVNELREAMVEQAKSASK